MIAAEVVAVIVFAVLRAVGVALIPTAVATVAVGIIGALLAVRAPSDISVYGRVARRLAYLRRSGRTPDDPPVPFDLPQSDGTAIGLRWADDRLITVIRIARPVAPTALIPSNTVVSTSGLSLGVVARALSQFDIELESIDVVAHGWRSRAAAHLTGPYSTLTANLPTVPQQDVWVVLRLNPLLCPDAIAARGGGPTGVLRTAVTATRRVANHLAHEGYRPSILSAAGITAMGAQLVDHAQVDDAAEGWTSIADGSYSTTCYAVTRTVDADLSTDIWTTPSLSTTCATRLRREGAGYELSTVVRYSTVGDLTLSPPAELRRLDGHQRAALARTLPAGRDSISALPRDVLDLDALDEIRVVDGGHGQLFGANASGDAIAIPLFGSDVRRVDVYGSAFLTQQIVVRAIAVGARVVIRTDRPDTWAALVANVNDPRTLFMFGSPIEQRSSIAQYSLCILDAREATEDPTVGTQLRVHRTAGIPERLDETSDVAIYQDTRDQSRAYIVTRTETCAATLVALPSEGALIDGGRPVRRPQQAPAPVGGGQPAPSQDRRSRHSLGEG
ncbi:type VII secretion protein EccE [Williamsia deligens]|nr:type VII secretion protein EccE [Williamsia deligens]